MATQSMGSLQLDAKTVQNIIASRAIVKANQAGQTFRFHVQGNGNLIPVTTKEGAQVMSGDSNIPLMKTIYNIKANSHVAMLNPRNRAILQEAMQAETAGDTDLAHSKFNEYLNKIQVSFSVIQNPGRQVEQFYNKQLIEGEIELITTENGQLLTIANPRAVRVEKLGATPAFTLSDLMGLDDEQPTAETVFTPLEGATATPATQG